MKGRCLEESVWKTECCAGTMYEHPSTIDRFAFLRSLAWLAAFNLIVDLKKEGAPIARNTLTLCTFPLVTQSR
jgi:hypothetical protein